VRTPASLALVSDRNAAAIGLRLGGLALLSHAAAEVGYRKSFVAKNSKKIEMVVDSLAGRRLYTPHQRGRRAAGDEEVRF
jgi:ABC-type nitrate/sulfonate/bicarbonate transport system substrate-binding protein